jgi:hypothetical protein
MKGLKVNMDMVNCGLLIVVLVLVVMCCVKREGFVGAPLNSNEHSQIEMFYGKRLKASRAARAARAKAQKHKRSGRNSED